MTRMKKHLRVISMLMVFVMVFVSIPSSIFAVDNTTDQVDQLSNTSSAIPSDALMPTNSIDDDITVINEVIELRTETVKHFRMSDGSFVLVEYNDPVHYLDDNNYYQDIDNTLAQNEDGTYGNTFNDVSFQFAENSNSDAIVTIENEGNTIAISALETNEDKNAEVVNPEAIELPEEKIEDVSVLNEISASVTYPEIFEKTDLEYVVEGKSLKENIIVKEAKEEYIYSFALHIEGLSAQLNEDGSISVGSADNVVYSIPAPFMYDAEGEISNDVFFDLVQNDDSYTLIVTADTEWINSEDRVFPVTIDPTVTTDNDGDTNMNRITTRYYVEGDSVDRASNSEGYIYNGYAKQESSTNRGDSSSYIKINTLPTLPEYSVITNATINLYQNGFAGNGVNEVELAMSEVSDEANWYTETTTDYVGLNTVSSATANKYLSWNITNLVKDWYEDINTNHGFRISNNTDMTSDCYATIPFVAYNSINTDNLPKLVINYMSSVGIEDYYSYNSQNIDRAGTGYVKLDDGSLSVIKNDLTAIGDHVDFELNHTYNSALSNSNYMSSRYPGMKFGYGWMLNIQEFAEKARLTNDSGNLAYYYIYTDGDGTVHYLYYDSGTEEYRDIDGLGLSLTYYKNSNGAEIATLYTAEGETKTFVEGYLSTIVDSKGNIFTFKYTTTTANKLGSKFTPSINRSRLLSVTQKLWSEEESLYSTEKTIATLSYNTDGYLASIVDGRGYTTTYTYANNLLTSVTHNDSKAAKYLYNNAKLTVAFDDDTNQGIEYTINSKGMVSSINEFAYTGTDLSYTDEYSYGKCLGLEANTSEGVTYLRDYGTNASNDDIVYHYVFDNSGRCVTSYSANKKTTDTADAFKIYGTELIQYTDYTTSSPNTANDITSIIRAGSIAQNLVQNGGAENSLEGWSATGNATASGATVYSGDKSFKLSSNTKTESVTLQQGNIGLIGGYTYTLSAYVKADITSATRNKGVYMYVYAASAASPLTYSRYISTSTDTDMNDGWEKISLTFTATANVVYGIRLCLDSTVGTAYFDAIQLEYGTGASNINMIENSSMEIGDFWSAGTYSTAEHIDNTRSLRLTSSNNSVYSSNSVNGSFKSGETYMLSGWAMANAMNHNETASSNTFSLNAVINYSDNTTETILIPFNEEVKNAWQYVTGAFTLAKNADSIDVICDYSYNKGVAYFDAMSLQRVVVNIPEDTSDESNDKVTIETIYGYGGGVVSTKIKDKNTATHMISNATYSENGLVLSETDENGTTVQYNYDGITSLMNAITANVSDTIANSGNIAASITYDNYGRPLSLNIDDKISVTGTYVNGSLNTLTRQGYIPDSENAITQTYTISTDIFGNVTEIKVGDAVLVTYEYSENNGNLYQVTYANGYRQRYYYDHFDRLVEILDTDDYETNAVTTVCRYFYNGDGTLHCWDEYGTNRVTYYAYDISGQMIAESTYAQTNTWSKLIKAHYVDDSDGSNVQIYSFDGNKQTYTTTVNEADSAEVTTITYGYNTDTVTTITDIFGRKTYAEVYGDMDNGYSALLETLNYRSFSDGRTTNQVSGQTFTDEDGYSLANFTYEYDNVGNIKTIKQSYSVIAQYTYDEFNQLVFEQNMQSSKSYMYTYDTYGNLREVNEYSGTDVSYADIATSTPINTITFEYSDGDNQDVLAIVNGDGVIDFNEQGNPTTYCREDSAYELTWKNGRLLNSFKGYGATEASKTTYEYDINGLRTTKIIGDSVKTNNSTGNAERDGGERHTYYYINGRLTGEVWDNKSLTFLYNTENIAYGFIYNDGVVSQTYYYVRNILGDIIQLRDNTMQLVASYSYDAWGNHISVLDGYGNEVASSLHIANINPLRYRGYYYDIDSGLYYLHDRYYDPANYRYLDSSVPLLTGLENAAPSYNLFAYCENNPVNMINTNRSALEIGIIFEFGKFKNNNINY